MMSEGSFCVLDISQFLTNEIPLGCVFTYWNDVLPRLQEEDSVACKRHPTVVLVFTPNKLCTDFLLFILLVLSSNVESLMKYSLMGSYISFFIYLYFIFIFFPPYSQYYKR